MPPGPPIYPQTIREGPGYPELASVSTLNMIRPHAGPAPPAAAHFPSFAGLRPTGWVKKRKRAEPVPRYAFPHVKCRLAFAGKIKSVNKPLLRRSTRRWKKPGPKASLVFTLRPSRTQEGRTSVNGRPALNKATVETAFRPDGTGACQRARLVFLVKWNTHGDAWSPLNLIAQWNFYGRQAKDTIKESTIKENFTTFDSSRARPIKTPVFVKGALGNNMGQGRNRPSHRIGRGFYIRQVVDEGAPKTVGTTPIFERAIWVERAELSILTQRVVLYGADQTNAANNQKN
ncbi:hypothetical protein BGY98DRAFT_931030 [Russula aff. rugulosa BPL654]|nr:hypothetical protein BGY98DRAFT_931030 [Russula aff. rugulosa BPL654]